MSEHFAWGFQTRFSVPLILGGYVQVTHRTPSLDAHKRKHILVRTRRGRGKYVSITENSHSAFNWGTREWETFILRLSPPRSRRWRRTIYMCTGEINNESSSKWRECQIEMYRVKLALRKRRRTLTCNRGMGGGAQVAVVLVLLRILRYDDIRRAAPVLGAVVVARTFSPQSARSCNVMCLLTVTRTRTRIGNGRQVLPSTGENAHLMTCFSLTDGGDLVVVSLRICHGCQWRH